MLILIKKVFVKNKPFLSIYHKLDYKKLIILMFFSYWFLLIYLMINEPFVIFKGNLLMEKHLNFGMRMSKV